MGPEGPGLVVRQVSGWRRGEGCILELRALDLSKTRLDAEDLKEMLEQNTLPSSNAPARLDDRLHRYWIGRSHNRYIQDFFLRHSPFYAMLYHYAVDHSPDLVPRLARQHQDILTAMIHRRGRQARQALAHDLESLCPILIVAIGQLNSGQG